MPSPLFAKLNRKMRLSPEEEGALADLIESNTYRLPARQDLYVEGDRASSTRVIIDGWACRYDQLADGRRQIVELLLPGDMQHDGALADRQPQSACSISPITYARICHRELEAVIRQYPRLRDAFTWEVSITAAIHRQWIRSLGRFDATQRIAHLLCELFYRVARTGLATGTAFGMPMGQRDLGDATGLSTVQVNRTVQALRTAGLLDWRHRVVEILDLPGLAAKGIFKPDYLDLHPADEVLTQHWTVAGDAQARRTADGRDLR